MSTMVVQLLEKQWGKRERSGQRREKTKKSAALDCWNRTEENGAQHSNAQSKRKSRIKNKSPNPKERKKAKLRETYLYIYFFSARVVFVLFSFPLVKMCAVFHPLRKRIMLSCSLGQWNSNKKKQNKITQANGCFMPFLMTFAWNSRSSDWVIVFARSDVFIHFMCVLIFNFFGA